MSNLSHTYHLKLTVVLSIIFFISMNCTHMGMQQVSKPPPSIYTEFTYYPNGEKEYAVEYLNGKLDGTSRHWSQDGVLLSESEYSYGKLHGTWKKYYSNGNMGSVKASYHKKYSSKLRGAKWVRPWSNPFRN